MEFNDLPVSIQEIAAKCLADRITYLPGLQEESVSRSSAKQEARDVRDAFIELYTERDVQDEDAPRPGFAI